MSTPTTPKPSPQWGEWLTPQQAADYTGYNIRSVHRWVENPLDAPPSYGEGHHRRFRRTEIDAWIESKRNTYQTAS